MPKYYLPLLLLLTGCASDNQNVQTKKFDYKSVSKIQLTVQGEDKTNEPLWSAISGEISQRFAKAGYPVVSATGGEKTADHESLPVTHNMEAVIEKPRLASTPVGISLDFGNSDPRAPNFQKTLSAPITCTLTSIKDSTQQISLKELKSISTDLENISLGNSAQTEKLNRFYVENAGSTCHNLLSRIKIKPVVAGKAEKIEETFKPAIRVETKYIKDTVKPLQPMQPAEVHSQQPADAKSAQPVEVNEKAQSEPDNVTTEENDAEEWQNKEITIFNQGDTVILKFGSDQQMR